MTNLMPFDVVPASAMEVAMTAVLLFVGLFLAAITISSTTAALSSIDSEDSVYRQQLSIFLSYMQSKNIDSRLLRRISEYFEYSHKASFKKIIESTALPRLPPDMSVELHIHLYRTLLLKCPIFDYQQFTMEAVLELLQELQPEVYAPKQKVVIQGDANTSLYIINRGIVEVWKDQDDPEKAKMLVRLSDNDFFGERSLLSSIHAGGAGGKTTATVQCVTYCDMLTLELHRFSQVLMKHGHQAHEVTGAIKRSAWVRDQSKTVSSRGEDRASRDRASFRCD
eukprot:7378075-Prymnesium_polylepis.1